MTWVSGFMSEPTMAKFGWCLEGRHADHKDNPCPARFRKWVHVPARGKKPASIEYLDEWEECTCSCHGTGPVQTKKRKKK